MATPLRPSGRTLSPSWPLRSASSLALPARKVDMRGLSETVSLGAGHSPLVAPPSHVWKRAESPGPARRVVPSSS
eukprot:14949122-Alexandrium_andersonii.AAC.1